LERGAGRGGAGSVDGGGLGCRARLPRSAGRLRLARYSAVMAQSFRTAVDRSKMALRKGTSQVAEGLKNWDHLEGCDVLRRCDGPDSSARSRFDDAL